MFYNVESRLKYIGQRQTQVRGEKVIYARGAAQVEIEICPGHTDVQDLTPYTAVAAVRYVDFIFTASDLNLPGLGIILPYRGDRITWRGDVYTLTAPTDTDDVYNFTTMYKDRIRVHTLLKTLDPH